jgi:hypothetical protein
MWSEAMHPRPQLRRADWISLDGTWDFADDREGLLDDPSQVTWSDTIVVPFAPETPASGIGDTGFRMACWYRRRIDVPSVAPGHRLVLHFGAVDHIATVWLDGYPVAHHEGGYSSFEADLTAFAGTGTHDLVVRAYDDPADLAKPRGKQDWELEPHSIWYHRTTGIWQTVWLEDVPPTSVDRVEWTADIERFELRMQCRIAGRFADGTRLRVRLSHDDLLLADDSIALTGSRLERVLRLDGTRVDTMRDALLWTPDNPALIDATLEVVAPDGTVVDSVESYAGMRTVAVRAGRFVLNDRPYPLRLVLDQGYWPESGLTPPTIDAFRHDLELAKAMGFNGVRKHQKIEDPRFFAWADRLGMMVWAEMPPAYRFDGDAMQRTVREWSTAIERDRSHPSIVAWVPFNESAGMLSLSTSAEQRQYVEAVALLTKALDPGRLVVANDGWETVGGDIIGVHDYDRDVDRLHRRYTTEFGPETLTGYATHGRLGILDDPDRVVAHGASDGPRAIVLTEFGGIGYSDSASVEEVPDPLALDTPDDRIHQPAAWGYSTVASPAEFLERYNQLLRSVLAVDRFAGFCYTQLTDTYQEVNGLLRADRTPKIPLEDIAAATLGTAVEPEAEPPQPLRAVSTKRSPAP